MLSFTVGLLGTLVIFEDESPPIYLLNNQVELIAGRLNG